ncbi:MAG TPA: hypothetical protein VF899_00775 [Pyrinomonadaceae bacterium]
MSKTETATAGDGGVQGVRVDTTSNDDVRGGRRLCSLGRRDWRREQ